MRARRDGFVLQEMAISMLMSLIVLGTVFAFVKSGITNSQVTTARALLDRNAGAALRAITDALLPAGKATLSAANAPLGASFLDFQVPASAVAAGIVWGSVTRIELRADPADAPDGVDNDGDGLVDEGEIVLHRNFGLASQSDSIRATPASGRTAPTTTRTASSTSLASSSSGSPTARSRSASRCRPRARTRSSSAPWNPRCSRAIDAQS